MPYSVPADFTYKFEGINVQYSYPTHTPIESSRRDASIAYGFCMHQSASRGAGSRFMQLIRPPQPSAASQFLGGGAKTREPARCMAHRAGSRAVLGTYRRGLRRPAPAGSLYAHDFQPQRRALSVFSLETGVYRVARAAHRTGISAASVRQILALLGQS